MVPETRTCYRFETWRRPCDPRRHRRQRGEDVPRVGGHGNGSDHAGRFAHRMRAGRERTVPPWVPGDRDRRRRRDRAADAIEATNR